MQTKQQAKDGTFFYTVMHRNTYKPLVAYYTVILVPVHFMTPHGQVDEDEADSWGQNVSVDNGY